MHESNNSNGSESVPEKNFLNCGFKAIPGNSGDPLAFLSLKIALNSFFCTYEQLRIFAASPSEISKNAIYYELYTETIVHFQHFFELLIKSILRSESEALVVKWKKSWKNLSDALKAIGSISDQKSDIQNILTIEFRESLNRLRSHEISKDKSGKINKIKEIILANENVLIALAGLRNRAWHRGVYFLEYEDLNEFVCKQILPIVRKIGLVNQYIEMSTYLPDAQDCDIDVIAELIKCYKRKKISSSKVNLIKAIGRATYKSPLSSYFKQLKIERRQKPTKIVLNGKTKHFSKASGWLRLCMPDDQLRAAQAIAMDAHSPVEKCPVCGMNALILYTQWPGDDEWDRDYVSEAKCHVCSFNLFPDIRLNRNPFKIRDYFEALI